MYREESESVGEKSESVDVSKSSNRSNLYRT